MARPIVALLTDFGTHDHYAGTLKGVVLGICPEATLVDITHDLPAHDVLTAALELAASYRYFPSGTVFLVVVDPAVGSSRRAIGAEAGEHRFVAPDNGVLTAVFNEQAHKKVVELTERRYARPTVSRTFEGRDRFAPAAGWLAKGLQLAALGRPIADAHRLDIPEPVDEGHELRGTVLRVDRFGNLVTNIDRARLERLTRDGAIAVEIDGREVTRLVATYADIDAEEVCALVGSTDHLEIAASAASAAERLGMGRGAVVRIRRQ